MFLFVVFLFSFCFNVCVVYVCISINLRINKYRVSGGILLSQGGFLCKYFTQALFPHTCLHSVTKESLFCFPIASTYIKSRTYSYSVIQCWAKHRTTTQQHKNIEFVVQSWSFIYEWYSFEKFSFDDNLHQLLSIAKDKRYRTRYNGIKRQTWEIFIKRNDQLWLSLLPSKKTLRPDNTNILVSSRHSVKCIAACITLASILADFTKSVQNTSKRWLLHIAKRACMFFTAQQSEIW